MRSRYLGYQRIQKVRYRYLGYQRKFRNILLRVPADPKGAAEVLLVIPVTKCWFLQNDVSVSERESIPVWWITRYWSWFTVTKNMHEIVPVFRSPIFCLQNATTFCPMKTGRVFRSLLDERVTIHNTLVDQSSKWIDYPRSEFA